MPTKDDETSGSRNSPTKAERLQVVYRELAASPAARSTDEAVDLLANTLLSVEDRLSGIKRGTGKEQDGRMYPARADNRHPVPGRSDVVRFRSRAHNTYVSTGGAILIVDLRGTVAFAKPGADGRIIEL